MKIFFSVGEPSGDLHASNLIRRLHSHDANIECVGFGGPKMEAAGCQLLYELTNLAVMFLGKAIANLRFFFRLIAQADQYFADNRVDAVVLIDYSGFNWWIARKAKRHGIPVFYYGVPQVWAWAPWRIRKIRKWVDHVLCKLPFEKEWFAKRNCRAVYVGHPYFDQLHDQQYDQQFLQQIAGASLVTLLPGSRAQEVQNNLPLLVESASRIAKAVPEARFAIACYNQKQHDLAVEIMSARGTCVSSVSGCQRIALTDATAAGDWGIYADLYAGKTPELMKSATVCLACSGSVSLELLYHRKPSVIIYKIGRWAMLFQSLLIRVRYITLVNLIATPNIRKNSWRPYDPDRPGAETAVMPEYLTSGNPSEQIAAHAIRWLTDITARQQVEQQLDDLAKAFAHRGASEKAADYILSALRTSHWDEVIGEQSGDYRKKRRLSA